MGTIGSYVSGGGSTPGSSGYSGGSSTQSGSISGSGSASGGGSSGGGSSGSSSSSSSSKITQPTSSKKYYYNPQTKSYSTAKIAGAKGISLSQAKSISTASGSSVNNTSGLSSQQLKKAKALTESAQKREFGKVVYKQSSNLNASSPGQQTTTQTKGIRLSSGAGAINTFETGLSSFKPGAGGFDYGDASKGIGLAGAMGDTTSKPSLQSSIALDQGRTFYSGEDIKPYGEGSTSINVTSSIIQPVEKPLTKWQKANLKVASLTTHKVLKPYEDVTREQAKYEIKPSGVIGKIRTFEQKHPVIIKLPKVLGGDIDLFSSKKYKGETVEQVQTELRTGLAGGAREGFYTKIREKPLDVTRDFAIGAAIGGVAPFAVATKGGSIAFKTIGVIGGTAYAGTKGYQLYTAEDSTARGKILGETTVELGAVYAGAGTGARVSRGIKARIDVAKKPITIQGEGKLLGSKEIAHKGDGLDLYNVKTQQKVTAKIGDKTYKIDAITKGKQYVMPKSSVTATQTEYYIGGKKYNVPTKSISISKPTDKGFAGVSFSKTNGKVSLTPFKGITGKKFTVVTKEGTITYPQKTNIVSYISKTKGTKPLTFGVQQTATKTVKGGEIYIGSEKSLTTGQYKKIFGDYKPTKTKGIKMLSNKKGQASISLLKQRPQPITNGKQIGGLGTSQKNIISFLKGVSYAGSLAAIPLASVGAATGVALGTKAGYDIYKIQPQRRIQLPSLISKQTPSKVYEQSITPIQDVIQPQDQVQELIPDLVREPINIIEPITPSFGLPSTPIVDVPFIPFIPGKIPPILGGGFKTPKGILPLLKRPSKYQSSIVGGIYKIKRKKKSKLTGLEIRGI